MIFSTIWERYFLKEFVKVFFLFLFSFYFLYILIDYSMHAKVFSHANVPLFQLIQYYLYHFTKRTEVLVPFAIMLATVKVLCSLNINNELVALRAGGISLKTIVRPFLVASCALTVLTFINFEYITPYALTSLQRFEDSHFDNVEMKKKGEAINKIALNDGSSILYQHYDSSQQRFFDTYWFKTVDDIYHIKYLHLHEELPKGTFIDHLRRDDEGILRHIGSSKEQTFTQMHFNREALDNIITPYEYHAISRLWHQLSLSGDNLAIRTMLYFKLALPLICILAVIGPAPFCVHFSRNFSVFFIYAISIFALVALFTIMDTSVILGSTNVTLPSIAIWSPMALFFSVCGWNFFRMR